MEKLKIQSRLVPVVISIGIASIFIGFMMTEYGFAFCALGFFIRKLIHTYEVVNGSPLVLLGGLALMAFFIILLGYANVGLVRLLKLKWKLDIPLILCFMLASVFILSVVMEITSLTTIGALWSSQYSKQPITHNPTSTFYVLTSFALFIIPIGYANVLLAHKSGQTIFQQSAWLMANITTLCLGGLALLSASLNVPAIMIIISIIGAWVAAFILRSKKLLST